MNEGNAQEDSPTGRKVNLKIVKGKPRLPERVTDLSDKRWFQLGHDTLLLSKRPFCGNFYLKARKL
jgi:hypothetical protein